MEELTQLLKNRPSPARRTWRCADELQLAAYVDGVLDAKVRGSIEAHLADCTTCLDQVGFLMRAADWGAPVDAPPWLVNKARAFVSDRKPARAFPNWRWATAAFAAVLVMAVMVALALRMRSPQTATPAPAWTSGQPQTSPDTSPSEIPAKNPAAVAVVSPAAIERATPRQTEPSAPLIRNTNGERSPRVLFPKDGASVKRAALEVRWQTVPDAVFYEVSIISASGEVVMSRQTEDAVLRIPTDVQLTKATKYFASVRAHLRDGKTARSSVTSFRVND